MPRQETECVQGTQLEDSGPGPTGRTETPAHNGAEVPAIELSATNVFVARQPVFEETGKVFGYELLFRSGLDNFFPVGMNADIAASQVLYNSFLLFGMDVLVGGKKAFVNLTRHLIVDEVATLFPKENMVVELLESVEPDEQVIASCRKLKQAGYLLALDDFVFDRRMWPLIELADIIKVDFLATGRAQRIEIVRQVSSKRVRFLAEKVETKEAVEQARQSGYSLFQGYFFSKPIIIKGRDIPGHKLNYLQLLKEAMTMDVSLVKMGKIITRDVSLAYKLLRFINSAAIGMRDRVHSINHALALLGVKEIRKWVSLVALTGMGHDKSEELILSSLIRARFCELLAPLLGLAQRNSDLFLMGMFSMMDAFLDRPMGEILANLPLAEDIKTALMGERSRFREILELVLAYERGAWDEMVKHTDALNLPEQEVPRLYLQSVELANQIYRCHPE